MEGDNSGELQYYKTIARVSRLFATHGRKKQRQGTKEQGTRKEHVSYEDWYINQSESSEETPLMQMHGISLNYINERSIQIINYVKSRITVVYLIDPKLNILGSEYNSKLESPDKPSNFIT